VNIRYNIGYQKLSFLRRVSTVLLPEDLRRIPALFPEKKIDPDQRRLSSSLNRREFFAA
jgi:hypothetical protein